MRGGSERIIIISEPMPKLKSELKLEEAQQHQALTQIWVFILNIFRNGVIKRLCIGALHDIKEGPEPFYKIKIS